MDLLLLPSTDPLLIRIIEVGYRAWRRNKLATAAAILRQALAHARRCHDAAAELAALQLLGHVALTRNDSAEAATYHTAALELSQRVWFAVGEASSLHNLGVVAAASGDVATARDRIAAAIAIYEALGNTSAATNARLNLASLVAGRAESVGAEGAE